MDFSFSTIIIIILLIIIVYFVYTMLSSSSTTSSVTQAANTKTQLTVTTSNSFTFSIWINVTSWTMTGANKPIINTPTAQPKTDKYFNLSLGDSDNGLYVTVGGLAMPVIPNIPLQTWALITASVNNGNSLDIYINGKLVQTTALPDTFSLAAGSVDVGDTTSFAGFIFATFLDSPVGPQDVWNTYSSGYGSGGSSVSDFFNRYKIRFAFVKDNVELNSLDI